MRRIAFLISLLTLAIAAGHAMPAQESPYVSGGATPHKQLAGQTSPAFLQAADEVLTNMSKLIDLPIKEPLKKSLRSKDQIRAFIEQQDKEDKDQAQKYADDKTMEAFGLIPKGFPIESFMEDVLTDQIAGLYDPKAKEFYIADWIPVDEQKEVMAHELTHALEDQSFHIDSWIKAARPNDDAELARDSVSEGSAMAAMVDYDLEDMHRSVRDLPDVSALIQASAVGEMDKDPKLSKAPIYIRDSLIFPYLAGVTFTQQFLKAHDGWQDLHLIFEHPPVSTQQIMHPEKYLADAQPIAVKLPDWKTVAPADWKLLDENVMGEFGVEEVLKQFLGDDAAKLTSPGWTGDRYAVFEDGKDKTLPIVFVLDMDNEEDAARFFGQYTSALEIKYQARTHLLRQANFFAFQTDGGSVFVKHQGTQCLVVEEASRDTFDKIDQAITWPPPVPPVTPGNQGGGLVENVKAAPARNAMLAALN
ncbi:MAG TPA: hypothetical protein VJS43_03975 [Candidatus Acidoferrales bacterium]|nr:hypothetical protein [Candidatus Acidoferrales bacterium]